MNADIPVREMIIKNKGKAVFAISLVEFPAIEEDFIALNSMPIELSTINEDKRILMGAALVPDKNIYREDPKTKEPFYIFFSKETIKEASELYLKNYHQNDTTLEHKVGVEGVTMVESWIIEDTEKDKSAIHNLKLPVGTWVVSLKVDNDEIWNEYVKTGKLKGFSIEGAFSENENLSAEISKQINIDTMEKPTLMERAKTLLAEFTSEKKVELMDYEVANGESILVAETLEVGVPIFVKGAEGEENIPAPDGGYELADGTKLTVKDGMIEAMEVAEGTPEAGEEVVEQSSTELSAVEVKLNTILEALENQVLLTKEDVTAIVEEKLSELPIKMAKMGAPKPVEKITKSPQEIARMSVSERAAYHVSIINN